MGRRLLVPLVLLLSCRDVPVDSDRADRRLFPPRGIIRGTVVYVGPRPCSRAGHIVGNAVLLVFDRRNPPPPSGLAPSAVNFVAVPGDVLFANEPRDAGPELVCPPSSSPIEASASFAISPLQGGSYLIAAFYDRRGRFWPTFKFRDLPEAGDLGGGYIDVEDARKNAGNLAYQPIYRPIDVGIPRPASTGGIPDREMPDGGFVADNVPVSIGSVVPFTRPYFYPRRRGPSGVVEDSAESIGEAVRSPANDEADPLGVPILAVPQDVQVLAPPSKPTPETLAGYQHGFPNLELVWSVPGSEVDDATDPRGPFGFQLPPKPPGGEGGLLVFSQGTPLPDNPAVPALWPQVAFVKLADDPRRRAADTRAQVDPQSLVIQGTREETLVTGKSPGPLVVIQGITLLDDSLARTIVGPVPNTPTTAALRDHLTTIVRPAALCFAPPDAPFGGGPSPLPRTDTGGVLVTPHLTGQSADASEGQRPIFDPRATTGQPLVRELKVGCLPMGRYAITLVYPNGQAWTVPNESGGCSPAEGTVRVNERSCSVKERRVLLSQGSRAVMEIIGPNDPRVCQDHPVPSECLPP